MVGAAGNVHRHGPRGQGPQSAIQGALHDDPFAFDHGCRPWKSAPSDFLFAPLAVQGASPVFGVVREQDGLFRHGFGLEKIRRRRQSFMHDLVPQKAVLLHGETVPFGNIQNVARCKGNVHLQRNRVPRGIVQASSRSLMALAKMCAASGQNRNQSSGSTISNSDTIHSPLSPRITSTRA